MRRKLVVSYGEDTFTLRAKLTARPLPTGLITSLGWAALALWLFAGSSGQLAPMAAPKA
jgi:hypothetical protein